jgi:hypothetical protein
MNAENSQIVTLLKEEILNINANDENNDHDFLNIDGDN